MSELLSVVVPVLNEEEVLPAFIKRVTTVCSSFSDVANYEILFVDDGSTDGSREIITQAAKQDPSIRLISLSRNFGHQAALAAGFDFARGTAVVTIDCDLQDPPELIVQMVELWSNGSEIVLAKRRSRVGESRKKLWTAHVFYRLMSRMSDTRLSEDVADFRLTTREVVNILRELREYNPYYRGLVNWVGFVQTEIEYDRDVRLAGETKYTIRKMLRLAVNGLTAFSDKPLQMVSLLGLSFMSISGLGGLFLLIAKTIEPERSVAGYVSILLAVLFLGGVQLFSIGTLGIYLSVVNQNSKGRPRYLVSERRSFGLADDRG
jgi:glycosyltransferase involved in cell wall biosynthesis